MTAIKKTTTKPTKSPAPATKSTAVKAPAKKKPARPAPAAQPTTQAPVSVATPPAPVATTPTIKAIAAKPATTITARIDVGFGNLLYVRGEGPGLSWDKGVVMNCIDRDHWDLKLAESARPVAFKFLVNDIAWSAGADYIVAPGQSVTITPEF